MIVLGIETSTPRTTVAVGSEQGMIASTMVAARTAAAHEMVVPTVDHLLRWAGVPISSVGGIAVGLGPGLFTGMRVGIATAKTLAQVLSVPVAGLASLDVVAFAARYGRRLICATIDARRGELFYAFYRPVPGGVAREAGFEVGTPDHLAADLEARREDVLVVGSGALVYRRQLEAAGGHVELASAAFGYPAAGALVELAIPRFQREEFDRVYDLQPHYVRRSDAEINWDKHRGAG